MYIWTFNTHSPKANLSAAPRPEVTQVCLKLRPKIQVLIASPPSPRQLRAKEEGFPAVMRSTDGNPQ